MRHTKSGTWVAEPGDNSDLIFSRWGDFTPKIAMLNDVAGDQFMYGGLVFDNIGVAQAFDGFESIDDARTFVVEQLGVPAERIRTLEG